MDYDLTPNGLMKTPVKSLDAMLAQTRRGARHRERLLAGIQISIYSVLSAGTGILVFQSRANPSLMATWVLAGTSAALLFATIMLGLYGLRQVYFSTSVTQCIATFQVQAQLRAALVPVLEKRLRYELKEEIFRGFATLRTSRQLDELSRKVGFTPEEMEILMPELLVQIHRLTKT